MYAIHGIFAEIMASFPFFIGNREKENTDPGQEIPSKQETLKVVKVRKIVDT